MKSRTPDEGLARRLQKAGVLIHLGEKDAADDGLRIRQYGGIVESAAFSFRGLVTLVVLYVAITVDRAKFAMSGFDLELPWEGGVRWLPDPREIDGCSRVYRFGFEGMPDFDRDQALNHFANVRTIISRGRTLEGCLLGTNNYSMPDAFRHGATIPAFLTISDQFFREYR
jgi:hypothetical protein